MKKEVSVRIIRDDGKEFLIDHTVWGIPSDGLTGFDSVENTIYTNELAVGDGSRYVGSRVAEKDRTITARLMDARQNEQQRAAVIAFFNPKRSYKVYVTYMGRTRWCQGYQYQFECPTQNVYRPITFTWTILCPMPYMMSVDNFGKNLAEILPLYTFPFQSIVGYGFGVGVFQYSKNVAVQNNGDVETYFRCVITAKGEVRNPKIMKGDKYVRIIDTLEVGDVYEIDFENVPTTIKKNGANAIGKVDRTSSLTDMAIDVGSGTFGFDADFGSTSMAVNIYRYERYTGI